jgi:hypothetical protein
VGKEPSTDPVGKPAEDKPATPPARTAGGHGISSGLNPGGTAPGGGPGAGLGSIGTGGASTGGSPSGAVKREGR